MPPVAKDDNSVNGKESSNGDNKGDSNQSKTNGENSDKSETESEVRNKEKDSESDKRLDEGFVSDGSEKKVVKKPSQGSPKRPIAQNIYENLPTSPSKRTSDKTPGQVLQQVEVGDVINNNNKNHVDSNGERRLAPAPKDVYGQFPASPYKYSGPETPIQPLQMVTLKETQDQVKWSKEQPDGKRPAKPQTKMLEQLHVSIPVEQLDINAPIPISPSHPPSSPPRMRPSKPTPSKPMTKTSLTPKPVHLDAIPSPVPTRSPARSPNRAAPVQASPKPVHLAPKASPTPSRSPSRERAPAPTSKGDATPRLSRKDIPQRKDAQKTAKDTPGKPSKDRKDSKERSLSKDRSPASQKHRQSLRKQSSEQSQGLLDMTYMSEPVSTSPSFAASRNKPPPDFSHKLIALSRKGDWVGVDTILKWAFKNNVEPDVNAVSENSGWSPLMYAVKENRIQIVEQLLDLGYPVNLRAKVS